jgi:hypothetical protein
MDDFNTFTNFTCFSVIISMNSARHKESNVISFSTNDLQCMFVEIGGNFFLKNWVIIQMPYPTFHMYLWIEKILLTDKMELIMIYVLIVEQASIEH